MKIVDVAVGVIVQKQQVFISKRADDLHQGGLWEFPGGKVESNETIEQALSRELFEEIGIRVLDQSQMMVIEHDYGDKRVRLHIQTISQFDNQPSGKEGQQTQWVSIEQLNDFAFPAANQAIIQKLQQQ